MSAILKCEHLGFSHFEQKKLHSFILTQLDDGRHLEFCHLGFSHFEQKKLHSFILTQLDDGSHLEFCQVGFRHCHLGFRHLVIFFQIHSKTLSLHSELWLKLIQSYVDFSYCWFNWSIVVISGTVHRLLLKTIFHPLLWTSSGLTGSWKTQHLY